MSVAARDVAGLKADDRARVARADEQAAAAARSASARIWPLSSRAIGADSRPSSRTS